MDLNNAHINLVPKPIMLRMNDFMGTQEQTRFDIRFRWFINKHHFYLWYQVWMNTPGAHKESLTVIPNKLRWSLNNIRTGGAQDDPGGGNAPGVSRNTTKFN